MVFTIVPILWKTLTLTLTLILSPKHYIIILTQILVISAYTISPGALGLTKEKITIKLIFSK